MKTHIRERNVDEVLSSLVTLCYISVYVNFLLKDQDPINLPLGLHVTNRIQQNMTGRTILNNLCPTNSKQPRLTTIEAGQAYRFRQIIDKHRAHNRCQSKYSENQQNID